MLIRMDQADFVNAFQGMNLNAEELYRHVFGDLNDQHAQAQAQAQQQAGQSFNQFDPFAQFRTGRAFDRLQEEVNRMQGSRTAQREPIATSPIERREQINRELDIIRGVVPTPPGYVIDTRRIKALMTELNKLPKQE